MFKNLAISCSLILMANITSSLAQEATPQSKVGTPHKEVAKIIITRGDVKVQKANAALRFAKKDEWLKEGDTIVTGAKSVAKLIFKDNSRIGLAPQSSLTLKDFKVGKAGLISNIKGQIRSTISKTPLKEIKTKTKYYFRTKTAAIGVRGTDFQIFFNKDNERTMLLTYEGEVLMASVAQADIGQDLLSNQLENLITSDEAVEVERGQFSEVSPDRVRASSPTRISPSQFRQLRNNVDFNEQNKNETRKSFDSPIPRGVDPKVFINESTSNDSDVDETDAPPEGAYDKETKEYTPIAGGYIDAKTGLYVSPPPGSSFDPVAKVFTPPASYGRINPATGEYMAPPGWTLTIKGFKENLATLPKEIREAIKKGKMKKPKKPIIITPEILAQIKDAVGDEAFDNFIENFINKLNEADELDLYIETQKSNTELGFDFTVI